MAKLSLLSGQCKMTLAPALSKGWTHYTSRVDLFSNQTPQWPTYKRGLHQKYNFWPRKTFRTREDTDKCSTFGAMIFFFLSVAVPLQGLFSLSHRHCPPPTPQQCSWEASHTAPLSVAREQIRAAEGAQRRIHGRQFISQEDKMSKFQRWDVSARRS